MVGCRPVADDHNLFRITPKLMQQIKVRADFLLLENPGHHPGIQPFQMGEIIDPGKEHGRIGKQSAQVVQGEIQSTVVGHIDRIRIIAAVFDFQMFGEGIGVYRTQRPTLGIQIFRLDLDRGIQSRSQGGDEPLVLARGPRVLLAVGVDSQNTKGPDVLSVVARRRVRHPNTDQPQDGGGGMPGQADQPR